MYFVRLKTFRLTFAILGTAWRTKSAVVLDSDVQEETAVMGEALCRDSVK